MSTDSIISKVWGFCTTLRDDGLVYGDYLEQLTYLIFFKMADRASPGHSKPSRYRAGEGYGVKSCLSARTPAGWLPKAAAGCRSPKASPD